MEAASAAAAAEGGYRQLLLLNWLRLVVSYSGSGHAAVRVHIQAACNVSDTGSRDKSLCPHTHGRISSYTSFSLPGSLLLLQISRQAVATANSIDMSKSYTSHGCLLKVLYHSTG